MPSKPPDYETRTFTRLWKATARAKKAQTELRKARAKFAEAWQAATPEERRFVFAEGFDCDLGQSGVQDDGEDNAFRTLGC